MFSEIIVFIYIFSHIKITGLGRIIGKMGGQNPYDKFSFKCPYFRLGVTNFNSENCFGITLPSQLELGLFFQQYCENMSKIPILGANLMKKAYFWQSVNYFWRKTQ